MTSRNLTISSSLRSLTRVAPLTPDFLRICRADARPIPKIYVNPTSTRFALSKSTPAMRAIPPPHHPVVRRLSSLLLHGVAGHSLYCARPASTFLSCALREHGGWPGRPTLFTPAVACAEDSHTEP